MRDRREAEEIEDQILASFASKSYNSRGRVHLEDEHAFRTIYMRDRDRVIHSSAFRRLEYKTQVFIYHEGDHYRTRLTHTMEVAQIGRSIARALRLNEDLCEAIALSHDLGHPPFGHSGEGALDALMKDHGGFEHNLHALRVIDHVESRYPDFRGLNLSWETREAIAKHAKRPNDPSLNEFREFKNPSIEAQMVDVADSVAYNAHDLDDGLSSGLLNAEKLNEVALWRKFHDSVLAKKNLPLKLVTYQVIRRIINAQVGDLATQTEKNVERLSIKAPDDIRTSGEPVACFSAEMQKEHRELKRFLKKHMYKSHRVVRMEVKAYKVVKDLFDAYLNRPELLPENVYKRLEEEDKNRLICDYIAGMTDKYALEEHDKLFNPMSRV
ncbi:dNTP triphosphohydrolase, broad substrate specificity [hydrothermal vent metagenome]|uniref:DNTP triphosphohydrolase, broad substrate specificity n=1 Tax=hydrothermal vent metagenome TaxID=652676 RepID=A0A3B1CDJ7_9ZZZZ